MNRDPLEIIESIFEALDKGGAFTVNSLSKETGLHCLTVKRYIKLIKVIKREPEVEIIKTGRSVIIRIRKEVK
jgi:hypothetical protein